MAQLEEALACTSGTRTCSQLRSDEAWIRGPCVLGVDEAGRGPVLGPMVYAAAYAASSTDITGRGYDDSKVLTEAKRAKLFEAINSDAGVGWVAHVQSAQYLSYNMLARDRISLNALAMDATVCVIRTALDAGVNVKEVFVDTVGDPDRHRERLSRAFPGIEFTVCPKADSLYPIVSAASIVAKVLRDRALEASKKSLGLSGEVGSGYPGDAATAAWLRQHVHPLFGFPKLVRHSWDTCSRMLEPPEGVSMKFEADDAADKGEGGAGQQQQQRLNFARPSGHGLLETSGLGRHMYFRARKLQRLNEAF